MTIDTDELQLARTINEHKRKIENYKASKRELDRFIKEEQYALEVAQKAAVDYMVENGVISTDLLQLKYSESVIVDEVDALPHDYTRVTIAPDKVKIKTMRPNANWYWIERKPYIVTKGEK